MVNVTSIISQARIEQAQQSSGEIMLAYLKGFIANPVFYGLITLAVVVVLGLVLKQMLDNQETWMQNKIFGFVVHFAIFMGTLLMLILVSAGEVMILNEFSK